MRRRGWEHGKSEGQEASMHQKKKKKKKKLLCRKDSFMGPSKLNVAG